MLFTFLANATYSWPNSSKNVLGSAKTEKQQKVHGFSREMRQKYVCSYATIRAWAGILGRENFDFK